MMETSDPIKGSKNFNDIMYRRLKNRERQRRYRERKRLQADASKARIPNQSSSLQIVPVPTNQSPPLQIVSLPTNGTVDQVVTRVLCKRDWKKDARRAHAGKQEAISNGLASSGSSAGENHFTSGRREAEQTLGSAVPSESCARLNDSEKFRSKLGRRDWKAEARNKK